MTIPQTIGRYKIIRVLGRGSQGIVYLAEDQALERPVAIKTLSRLLSPEQAAALKGEARTVSKLRHPNIISVYDLGDEGGKPFVVFEYVEGESLREMLRQRGPLPGHEAADLMNNILSGVACAHQQGIIHRDLNPANILIDGSRMPRVMDFGISAVAGSIGENAGTPQYMSPEQLSQEPLSPRSDVFSLGLILYEMVVGKAAFTADSSFSLLFKIANQALERPSRLNAALDEGLDGIILRALEKKPELRYGDALEMKRVLEDYLGHKAPVKTVDMSARPTHATVDFLIRRMQTKGDFPAFSQNIVDINRIAASTRSLNYSSASELANVILRDFSLTNRLLKVVNSAYYGRFAGQVTTISRAVLVLGLETVRKIALGLMLFDHMQSRSHAQELQETTLRSFTSGMIAQDLAERKHLAPGEEAFICAMLHNLGRLLVIRYFAEDYDEIKRYMSQKGMEEGQATIAVLGIPYAELGMAIARSWNFPERVIHSMETLPQGDVERPRTEQDTLRQLANYSNEICEILQATVDVSDQATALQTFCDRYQGGLFVSLKQLRTLLSTVREDLIKVSDALNLPPDSHFLKGFRAVALPASRKEEGTPGDARRGGPSMERPGHGERILEAAAGERVAGKARPLRPETEAVAISLVDEYVHPEKEEDDSGPLISGIHEITKVLLGTYELNGVLSMILETIYRGFGFNRVLFAVLNSPRTRMSARFGLGAHIRDVIGQFSFPLDAESPDVFNLSVFRFRDCLVEDASSPDPETRIPMWYRQTVAAPAFLLYPLAVKGLCLGLFYADRTGKGPLVTERQLKHLITLRNQAVLAIKQKL